MLVGLSFVDIIASFYIFLSFVHNERNARVTAAAVRNRAYGIFSMPPRGMYLEKRSTSMAKQDKISTQTDHADHAPTRVCKQTDLSGLLSLQVPHDLIRDLRPAPPRAVPNSQRGGQGERWRPWRS